MLLPLLKAILALSGGFSSNDRYPSDYGPHLNDGDEFDFIVVGAGSAGSVVASRLSEITDWNVLLLEAGGYPSDISEIPALMYDLFNSDEDWQYKLEPSEASCLSYHEGYCKCPAGKGLGGGSLINAMLYTRTTKYDHDRWVNMGNTGWDHEAVINYYKRIENVSIPNNIFYGTTGPLRLTRYTSTQPSRQILMKAYEELGLHEYTEDKPLGYRDNIQCIYDGTRQSSSKAFLAPARNRHNLYLAINSHVSKVLLDPNTSKVNGVEVQVQNRLIKIKAKREVILSAGTIRSPQILLNSGIGPKEHLAEIGIELVKDLRVGDNFQDHVSFPLLAMRIDNTAVMPLTNFQLISDVYRYFTNGRGALSELDITNFSGYINTKSQSTFANVQIMQVLVHQRDLHFFDKTLRSVGTSEEVRRCLVQHNQESPILMFVPILQHPKSRGYIRLRTNDPFANPLIVPNFLNDTDGDDIRVLLDAIKYIQKLTETKAFASHNTQIIDLNITNCKTRVPQSDDFWRCAIRNIAMTAYHPIGTCKMGPASDPTAVVDPRLKVYGIKSLRVIDASIIPIATSSGTNAAAIMIGEKGSDLIKEDWLVNHDEL